MAMFCLTGCAGPDVSQLSSEMDALTQRVQTLEGRLKKLEGGGMKGAKSKAAKAKAAKAKGGRARRRRRSVAGAKAKVKADGVTPVAAKAKTKAKAAAVVDAAPVTPGGSTGHRSVVGYRQPSSRVHRTVYTSEQSGGTSGASPRARVRRA